MSQAAQWQNTVYRPAERTVIPPAIEARVRRRDNYRCQVGLCGARRNLSLHHIKPRREGGPDIEENLISLCVRCHDEIEDAGITTKLGIKEFVPERLHDKAEPKKRPIAKAEKANEGEWQTWVYGGARNPNK